MNANGNMRGPMRSLSRDHSITRHKIAPGIRRRILCFAKPYKASLVVFLILVVADAAISALNPLILREIINDGIINRHRALIIDLAILVAGLAIIDALIQFFSRYISAKIG
jgi:ATP-binding cassette subfamily B protein